MNDMDILIKIRDAIGSCRLDPSIGHEFTIRFPKEDGGGEFVIRIQNANATKGSVG